LVAGESDSIALDVKNFISLLHHSRRKRKLETPLGDLIHL